MEPFILDGFDICIRNDYTEPYKNDDIVIVQVESYGPPALVSPAGQHNRYLPAE